MNFNWMMIISKAARRSSPSACVLPAHKRHALVIWIWHRGLIQLNFGARRRSCHRPDSTKCVADPVAADQKPPRHRISATPTLRSPLRNDSQVPHELSRRASSTAIAHSSIGRLPLERSRYQKLAETGQRPEVMVICCCNLRVSPEVIFDAHPGEMFVVRNVANLVPPYTPTGFTHGVSAALEFAVSDPQGQATSW